MYKVSLTFTFTFKVSSGTLNSVLRDSQTFASRKADFRYVTVSWQPDFRDSQTSWRVTQYFRYGQNLHTSQQVPTT